MLRGAKGFAWRIPSDEGAFILTLRINGGMYRPGPPRRCKNRGGVVPKTRQRPLRPLEAKQISSREDKTKANGTARTLTYEWQAKQGKHKLVFVLSTSSYPKADLQAFASVSLVTEE